ncbi:MAG: glycosyltransferase family 9 protein [Pseudomonadota bacterium]
MNILIIKLSAVGDVVLSLPFLAAIRRAYPQARLTWLVEEAAADLLTDHPLLDQVIISGRKSWGRLLRQGRLRRAIKEAGSFYSQLRRMDYDLVIDLQGLFKSGILTYLSGSRRRVGFDRTRELSYLFVNERLAPYDPDRHALLRYLDVAAYLGAEVAGEAEKFDFPAYDPARVEAERLLAGSKLPLVAINPGAKWPSKLWPVESWQRLIKGLAEAGITVIMTGSQDEKSYNRRMAGVFGGLVDLTGLTTLKVLAEVFRRVSLVVCPDTGPMHLAAAAGTPVVALFGPSAPNRTGPFGPGHVVLRTGISCSPCFRKKCPDPRCLSEIDPDQVRRLVLAKLEAQGPWS